MQAFQAQLLTGPPPASHSAPERSAGSAPVDESPLTLREGFDLALDAIAGKYASTQTRRYDQMLKFRSPLFGTAARPEVLIDPFLPWTAFEARHARALWRTMADRWVATGGREFGVRSAEQVVDALYSVAAWLREEHHIPADSARPPEQWRKRLEEEWAARTGQRRARPQRPRHTEAEYRRIFAALVDPRVDPRIRLAIEIAAECRTGQRRSPVSSTSPGAAGTASGASPRTWRSRRRPMTA